jgi:hypothetical protein
VSAPRRVRRPPCSHARPARNGLDPHALTPPPAPPFLAPSPQLPHLVLLRRRARGRGLQPGARVRRALLGDGLHPSRRAAGRVAARAEGRAGEQPDAVHHAAGPLHGRGRVLLQDGRRAALGGAEAGQGGGPGDRRAAALGRGRAGHGGGSRGGPVLLEQAGSPRGARRAVHCADKLPRACPCWGACGRPPPRSLPPPARAPAPTRCCRYSTAATRPRRPRRRARSSPRRSTPWPSPPAGRSTARPPLRCDLARGCRRLGSDLAGYQRLARLRGQGLGAGGAVTPLPLIASLAGLWQGKKASRVCETDIAAVPHDPRAAQAARRARTAHWPAAATGAAGDRKTLAAGY